MGQNGLSSLLSLAGLENYLQHLPADTMERQFDFAALSALNQALEEMYGLRGGRGMALKIGQATFAKGLKDFGVMRAINDPIFKALDLPKRSTYGLEALAGLFSHFTDQDSIVQAEKDVWLFRAHPTPFAWGRKSDKPLCHMLSGIILESLRWSSNGYEFYVRETHCAATGHDACLFRVNKTPMAQPKN